MTTGSAGGTPEANADGSSRQPESTAQQEWAAYRWALVTYALRAVKGRKYILGRLLMSAQASAPHGRALVLRFRYQSMRAKVEHEFKDPWVLEVVEKAIADAYGTPLTAVLVGPYPALKIYEAERQKYVWSYSLLLAGLATVGLSLLAGFLHIREQAGIVAFLVFSGVAAIISFLAYTLFVSAVWLISARVRKRDLECEAQVEKLLYRALSEVESDKYEPDPDNETWKRTWLILEQALRVSPHSNRVILTMFWFRRSTEARLERVSRRAVLDFLHTHQIPGLRAEGTYANSIKRRTVFSLSGLADRLFTPLLWSDVNLTMQSTMARWTSAPVMIAVACGLLLIIPVGEDRYGETYVGRGIRDICASYLLACASDVRGHSAREAVQKLEDILSRTYPHHDDRVFKAVSPFTGQTLTCYEMNVEWNDWTRIYRYPDDTSGTFTISYGYAEFYDDAIVWDVEPPTQGRGWSFEVYSPTERYRYAPDDPQWPSEGLTCQP